MAATISPLAPTETPIMPNLAGVGLQVAATGLRYKNRDDLLLIELPAGTAVAGTLTRSQAPSAPVDWCRQHLPRGTARAILVNAGNANAATGQAGIATVEASAAAVAARLGCCPEEVLLASTGVVGAKLASDAIAGQLPKLAPIAQPVGWQRAAAAIMTTDTFPKLASAGFTQGGHTYRIAGIAKGSGMIAPDMATMLAFVVTDAPISPVMLRAVTRKATELTFNRITVDSDTSTSDTLLVAATGTAGGPLLDRPSLLAGFRLALTGVLHELAELVVRDGEGASKLITVTVTGAATPRDAKRAAVAIANSPLVKTAIAGEDANWGRVVMALGKSGARMDRDLVRVAIGKVEICREGEAVPGYDEAPVAAHLKGDRILVEADLGLGSATATMLTCDLTEEYIRINARYRS